MPSRTSKFDSDTKLAVITAALDDKKAVDPEVIPMEGRTLVADYFVLATGTSSVHIRALADGVEEAMESKADQRARREGHHTSNWMLLDYGDVVVHIFTAEAREMYSLESLWRTVEDDREGAAADAGAEPANE